MNEKIVKNETENSVVFGDFIIVDAPECTMQAVKLMLRQVAEALDAIESGYDCGNIKNFAIVVNDCVREKPGYPLGDLERLSKKKSVSWKAEFYKKDKKE